MPNLVAATQAEMGFSMRQSPASSDDVLASLSANATQQLGDAILWLCTLVACVPLLLLLLHAVGTTTGLGPNRFAGTATAGISMLSKVVLLSSGVRRASRPRMRALSALSGCVPCHRSCVGERCWRLLWCRSMHSPPRVCRLQHD